MANDVRLDSLVLTPEALTSAVAASLIAELNRDLSADYPEPGTTHFRLELRTSPAVRS